MQDWLAFALLGLLAITLGVVWVQGSQRSVLGTALLIGIALRLIGSTARLEVIERLYSGVGDAKSYFDYGRMYADQMWAGDFDFLSGAGTTQNRWWGTQFVRSLTALFVLITGESYRATFLAFALLAFAGMVLCVRAFGSIYGRDSEVRYARWVWLWPSLWFWPSSIGKEALMLFAVGIVFWGYVVPKNWWRWVWVGVGLALAGAIRPHVAAALACCVVTAESLGPGSMLSVRRIGGMLVAGGIAVFSISMGLEQMGLEDADIEGMQEQFEFRSDQTLHGHSQIEMNRGWSAIPMSFITILMRPFPWEARGVALLSAAEISFFWLLVASRLRPTLAFVGNWRRSPFTRLALPVVLSISLMYGLAFANLGIIARQRAVLLPFLLSLLTVGRKSKVPELSARVPQLPSYEGS